MSAPLLQELERGFAALPPELIDAGGLGAARRAQFAAALAAGLPGARAERWRHTSLRALERRAFSPLPAAVDTAMLARTVAAASASDTAAATDWATLLGALAQQRIPRLVFVNGVFAPELSHREDLPAGVTLAPLSAALAAGETVAVQALDRRYAAPDEAFARFNAAFAAEGLQLEVAAGVQVAQPMALVLIGAAAEGEHAVHLRHRIVLGEGASLVLCEYALAASAQSHLVNSVADIVLGRGAHLDQVRVQAEHTGATLIARSDATLAAAASYRRIDLEFGAALSRHELNVTLAGDGARLSSGGVLLADGRRHLDTRLAIDHAARDTACELTWRGLGAERGRVVFHGGILIRPGADGTSAQLSNKNLLLSANAEIDTQPVLEIHADEVQASHGATVGQLDENALFYLRSRGLTEVHARTALTLAFCRVVLDTIADESLRARADAFLDARLPQVAA